MNKVHFYSNLAPHYRKNIWSKLLNNDIFNIEFFFSEDDDLNISNIDLEDKPFSSNSDRLHELRNIWIFGKVLIWQFGVLKSCLFDSFDKGIFLGEAYCLSNWVAAVICRVRNIEVIFWGHGLYGNEGSLKLLFRKTFYRLANKHLIYERRAKKLMIKEGFDKDSLYIVFNSLDYNLQKKYRYEFKHIPKGEIFDKIENPNLPVLIFIGRLTPSKDLDLLIQAVNEINEEVVKYNLVIIGSGEERKNLEKLAERGINNEWVNFVGACYDEIKIAKYLSAADLCISPGNVGLTAVHSLSYGTPVCTHDDMANQMPEAEAITEGYNGFFFKKGCVDDLRLKIEDWFNRDIERQILRENCFEIIDTYYNPDYQLSVFNRLIKGLKPII